MATRYRMSTAALTELYSSMYSIIRQIQGGLHHFKKLPDDLEQTLLKVARLLREGVLFLGIEPWLTPFLAMVHCICRYTIVRQMVPKIDALLAMIDHERETYEQWLAQPQTIEKLYDRFFPQNYLHANGASIYTSAVHGQRPVETPS